MSVEPSCPALLILDEDDFRKSLIRVLDERHFMVTFTPEGDGALGYLRDTTRRFRVVILGLDINRGKGLQALDYIREHRDEIGCGLIILGEPHPDIRSYAPWADETLLKPVDPDYVATRARTYCGVC